MNRSITLESTKTLQAVHVFANAKKLVINVLHSVRNNIMRVNAF